MELNIEKFIKEFKNRKKNLRILFNTTDFISTFKAMSLYLKKEKYFFLPEVELKMLDPNSPYFAIPLIIDILMENCREDIFLTKNKKFKEYNILWEGIIFSKYYTDKGIFYLAREKKHYLGLQGV